jgi:hypothetical protein
LLVDPNNAANKLIKLNTFSNKYRDVIYNNKYIMMLSDNEDVSFLMLKDYAVEKASLVTRSGLCTSSGNYTTLGVIDDKFIAFEDYNNRAYYRIISLVGEESGAIADVISDEKVNRDVALSAPIFA